MRSKALFFASAMLCASNIPATALSWNTQLSCSSDYYAYCSKHIAGSAGCHACMRANRAKLSNSCVSALIDDGVLPKAGATQQKTKVAAAKAKKAAPRSTARSAAKQVAKAPPEEFAATTPPPEAASSAAPAGPAAPPETVARAPDPPVAPPQDSQPLVTAPQQPVEEPEPGIDQGTFEAFKNRAPYFVPTPETMMLEGTETAANAPPQPPSIPR
ncbi:hypothetical protein [Hyphomicrobium sp.]|uniref:hypothetical protein n=1 Tax=Hyphomicrobium sp. TaxID=82 RepID=UPI003F72C9C2